MFFKLLSYHIIKASKNSSFIKNQLMGNTNKLLIYSDQHNITNNISYKMKQYYIGNNKYNILKVHLALNENITNNNNIINNMYDENIMVITNINSDKEIIYSNIRMNNNIINYNVINNNLLNIIDYYGFLNKISNRIDIYKNLNFLFNNDKSIYYELYSYYIKILNNLCNLPKSNIINITDTCYMITNLNDFDKNINLINIALKENNDIIIDKQLKILLDLIKIIKIN